MKIFASTLAVLLVAPAAAQDMSVMTQAFEIMRASGNLNDIIDNWNSGGSQPVCGSPTDNCKFMFRRLHHLNTLKKISQFSLLISVILRRHMCQCSR